MIVSQPLLLDVTLQIEMKEDQIYQENDFLLYARPSFMNEMELTKAFILSN